MVTDTVPFRYPYYYTPDKINHDRFAYMFDILKMTVAKLVDVKFT